MKFSNIRKTWMMVLSTGMFFGASALSYSAELNLESLEKSLMGSGLTGWVHGVYPERGLYVFTYRKPGDFFNHYEFPMVPQTEQVLKALKTLRRHDAILLKGEFLKNESPQKHILVGEVKVQKSYSDGVDLPAYEYDQKAPSEVLNGKELLGKIHAIAAGGKVLVIEYRDLVVPVFVESGSATEGTEEAGKKVLQYVQSLHRGDKIRLRYVVRLFPDRPYHVSPDLRAESPLQATERITDVHGKKITREGVLVWFPVSPQISRNVYALQHEDKDGILLEYTLVNFDDPKIFDKITEKLKKTWEKYAATAVRGRNKYVNPKLKIRATGLGNVVDANQANPQILLETVDSVEILSP